MFSLIKTYDVGGSTTGVKISDINRDGLNEVLIGRYSTALIYNFSDIISGQSLGTYNTAEQIIRLDAADLDGNGILDPVTANWTSGKITISYLRSDFSQIASEEISVGFWPHSLSINDINNDGKQDIVVTDFRGETVRILTNEGFRQFTETAILNLGGYTTDVEFHDFDDDGHLDLIVQSEEPGFVQTYLNDGAGSFSPAFNTAVGARPHDMVVVDVNDDGNLDVLTVSSVAPGVTVLLGNGDGSFTAGPVVATSSSSSLRGIVAGDLDRDGNIDIAVSNHDTNAISILKGNGDGTFEAAREFAVGPTPFFLDIGDVDGDGWLDIVATSAGSSLLTVLYGDATRKVVKGTTGKDTLRGTDAVETFLADDGDDSVLAGKGDDALQGGAGNDRLDGGLGADRMGGGTGNDIFFVNDAGDTVIEFGGNGSDTVFVTAAAWVLGTGQSVEILRANVATGVAITGNGLNQSIYGAAGADTLDGGGGIDRLYGGAGDDTYRIGTAGAVVSEGAVVGTDTVEAAISYTLTANVENLTLTGTGNLRGTGNSLANVLIGNAGANVLTGGAGDDTLTGGLGKDQMSGGTGHDTFVFETLNDSTFGTNRDLITGFTVSGADSDKLDLSAIGAFLFVGAAGFTGNGTGEVHAVKSGSYTLVEGDVDGNGAADFQILLQGVLTLDADNFVL